jgi:addiction module RelE/StbE family toxin
VQRAWRWTPRALARLQEIADVIAQDNPERAQTFALELRDKTQLLRQHQLGAPGRVFGTRELVLHKNYFAVYRVKGKEVHILTLFHAAQRR